MRIFILTLVLFFCACGTKRQYFEPSQTEGVLNRTQNLKGKIVSSNIFSASLSNGEALLKSGENIENFKLEKGYHLLTYEDGEFIIADNDGNLKILDNNYQELYSEQFDSSVLSVALDGDDIALVLANNTIILTNRTTGVKFSHTFGTAIAQDSRVAAPVFLDNTITYPTLDGKIVIFSRYGGELIKDILVSTEFFFNNIIYFRLMQDKIIAASAKKIIVFSPSKNLSLNADIKEVVANDDSIFIFEKNGNVTKTDFDLNKKVEKKFEFAIFTQANIYNNHLYMIEKNGYLIKSDLNLENTLIFKIPSIDGKMSFMGATKFYYENKILDLL